jgi:hypothetical protein
MKKTVELTKIIKRKSSPEIVVKYIYKNVFGLMQETILKNPKKFLRKKKAIRNLAKNYSVYYEEIINKNDVEWPKTILPPYIHGHKNFYIGVAGRLAFFSHNLEREAYNYNDREKRSDLLMSLSGESREDNALKEAAEYLNCNQDEVIEKLEVLEKLDDGVCEIPADSPISKRYTFCEIQTDGSTKVMYMPPDGTIEEPIPDAYYWYGNPKNWSDCYDISLDKNNELVIRKGQIVILDFKPNEEDMTEDEYTNDLPEQGEILLVPKTNLDNYLYIDNYLYNYIDNFEKTSMFPLSEASCNHTVDQECIEKMMSNYKINVSKKNGYSPEIYKLWTEYNKIKAYYKKNLSRKINSKQLREYKILEEEKSVELEKKFSTEYKNKLVKIKEKVEQQIEAIPEEDRRFQAIELNWLNAKLNQVINKYFL